MSSTTSPSRSRFLKRQHLCSPREFQAVYDAKRRASDGLLLIFGLRNELGWTRIGLSVGRKQGNAVRRARIKRLLREAFRLTQHDLPAGLDLVLIPQAGTSPGVEELRASLRRLTKQLERRLPRVADVSSAADHSAAGNGDGAAAAGVVEE